MKFALAVLCLTLCGAMATPFTYADKQELEDAPSAIYQLLRESFNDAIYQDTDKHMESPWGDEGPSTAAEVQYSDAAVRQGSTIALQTVHEKRTWLSCYSDDCHRSLCPGIFMDPSDWNDCYGEVFQIYKNVKQDESSFIRVGDVVGLYYPREEGNWFSMAGGYGHKKECPGTPDEDTGFSSEHAWFQCWGEVFKIFAREKLGGRVRNIGEKIKEHDIIMLSYINQNNWVGFFHVPDLRTCPGSTYPPNATKYDECYGEIAELWLPS